MSAITISPLATDPTRRRTGGMLAGGPGETGSPSTPVIRPLRPTRPSRGSGRGRSPQARPRTAVAPPRLAPRPHAQVRGCTGEAAALRLTDRGIAVIVVAGLMVMVASLVVIGATAMRVTGENYRPTNQSQIVQADQLSGGPVSS